MTTRQYQLPTGGYVNDAAIRQWATPDGPYLDESSPRALTLTAAVGTFTETGEDASLVAARTLTAAVGAFTETGQAANLRAGHALVAAAGSFTETGQPANLLKGYVVAAAAGSFAETGQAAALLAGRLITGAYGVYTETGQAASLTRVIPAAFSGGWHRQHAPFRDESATEREARIHAERVRLGILPPAPEHRTALEAAGATIAEGAATGVTPDPGLALDLAQLYTSAYLDMEIARHFALQDEDDAAVLLLAIATLH